MPFLFYQSESNELITLEIATDRFLLGRHPDCDCFQPFEHEPRASRFHAEIFRDDNGLWLVDRGSRRGTRLNGRSIKERVRLVEGDCVRICDIEFTFSEYQTPSPAKVHCDDKEPADPNASSIVFPMAHVNAVDTSQSQLQALLDVLSRFGNSLDIDVSAQELLQGLFTLYPRVERGFVAIITHLNGTIECEPNAFLQRNEANQYDAFTYSRSIIQSVCESREALLSTHADVDERLPSAQSVRDLGIMSLVCIPLLDQDGKSIGVVQLDNGSMHEAFSAKDLRLMAAITNQASIALRYAHLHAKTVRQQLADHDLQLASQVQLALLSTDLPSVDSLTFHAYYQAAHEVGGDFYDFTVLPNGRLAMLIADAPGRGISAVLLMVKLAREFKYFLSTEQDLASAVSCMNNAICQHGPGNFVTLAVIVTDPKTGEVSMVNAGHHAPLLRRQDGSVRSVGCEERGAALGLMPGFTYEPSNFRLRKGDSLYAFTDGLSNAMDPARLPYGDARLSAKLSNPMTSVVQMCDDLLADIQAYVRGQSQSDDMCLVARQYEP